ncbi:unnamed protein product [Oncorhynchus mykiss]|uniref:Uncharacterized protein n=1 Tax=Oncorhynchus mykiss TaxID=8022 RepID=A0A060ZCR3_ONCMY|nr:unnamed protein product [Oncorhynchus mykiss]
MEDPYEGPGISGQEDVTEGKYTMGDPLDKTFPFGSTLWETRLIKRSFWQYTMGDLLERIQASEEELEAQLQTIHACEVNGKNNSQIFQMLIFSQFFHLDM